MSEVETAVAEAIEAVAPEAVVAGDQQVGRVETPATDEPEGKSAKEPVKPEEQKKEELKAERLRKLLEREKAALDIKREIAEQKRSFEQERQQFEATVNQLRDEYQQYVQQKTKLDTQVSQFQTLLGDLRKDPIRFLQQHFNMTPEQVVERFANDGKPNPNELVAEELGMTRRELAELKKEMAAEREAQKRAAEEYRLQQEEYRRQQEEAEREATVQKTEHAFINTFTDTKRYPNINIADSSGERLYPDHVVLQQARQIVAHYGPAANNMTLEQLADELETLLKEHHSKVGRPVPEQQSVSAPAVKAEDGISIPNKAKTPATTKVRRTPTQTLSNDMAGRSTVKTKSSHDEEKARLIQELSR